MTREEKIEALAVEIRRTAEPLTQVTRAWRVMFDYEKRPWIAAASLAQGRIDAARTVWVPVTERLPDKYEPKLVSVCFGNSPAWVGISSFGQESRTWSALPKGHHVIAWAELPEPYQEDKR